MATMRVTVDSSLCMGHARCNASAPEIYELNDDGYAVIRRAQVPPGMEAQAQEGADVCPERAITVEAV
jgi:ferredoxin